MILSSSNYLGNYTADAFKDNFVRVFIISAIEVALQLAEFFICARITGVGTDNAILTLVRLHYWRKVSYYTTQKIKIYYLDLIHLNKYNKYM